LCAPSRLVWVTGEKNGRPSPLKRKKGAIDQEDALAAKGTQKKSCPARAAMSGGEKKKKSRQPPPFVRTETVGKRTKEEKEKGKGR